ncbi:serine/threonine-protein phosphatase 4 regulatory subunit 2-like [Lactuca sativa]|uniref:serine/threonine-protein phosphatase 4 regulatory subunit 2-like n=1 Tax=Lactuca sativa TaxID=4236 RepID=UPI0022AF9565|nr:serine/threonine-protein phosphatase 4 regulatory subunit 2-like [Lactuca sativa]
MEAEGGKNRRRRKKKIRKREGAEMGISKTDKLAGFHLPGDPYFPNEGNAGWLEAKPEDMIEEDPEEDAEEDPEEEEEEVEEEEEEDEEEGPEVYDPLPAHAPARDYPGPTPQWGTNLRFWSQEQGQPHPYGNEKGFYNLDRGGSADRALPVIIHHIARHDQRIRASTNQIMEVGATAEVTTARFRCLDQDHDQTRNRTEVLQQEAAIARSEVREYRKRQAAIERRMIEMECQAVEDREEIRAMRALIAALQGPPDATRLE